MVKKNEVVSKKKVSLHTIISLGIGMAVVILFIITMFVLYNNSNSNTTASQDNSDPSFSNINVDNGQATHQMTEEEYNKNEQERIKNDFTYQMSTPKAGDTVAFLETNKGTIKIKLFPNEVPEAVESFTKLAEKGYFNGLNFYSVIKNSMIKSGDPKNDGTGGQSIWGKPFEDEFTLKLHHFRGALSMDSTGMSTNGSRFFIVQNKKITDSKTIADMNAQKKSLAMNSKLYDLFMKNGGEPSLDWKNTIFGQVYDGIKIVDSIASVEVDSKSKPVKDVIINKVEIKKF
jgi:peptidyl-prolyl cis-trans isomerase B (cyclophilin B)